MIMTIQSLNDLSPEEKILLLPQSCIQILDLLQNYKWTFSEISENINFSDRTIRAGLKTLENLNLIEKFPILTDLRKSYYVKNYWESFPKNA